MAARGLREGGAEGAGLLHFAFYSTHVASRSASAGLADVRFDARFAPMKKYMCLICGWIYDEEVGSPEDGIAPGTRWEDVPPNWTCPECGARKGDFELVEF